MSPKNMTFGKNQLANIWQTITWDQIYTVSEFKLHSSLSSIFPRDVTESAIRNSSNSIDPSPFSSNRLKTSLKFIFKILPLNFWEILRENYLYLYYFCFFILVLYFLIRNRSNAFQNAPKTKLGNIREMIKR